MRALTIIVVTADAERLRGALVLAAAQAALGGDATVFLQLDAVALLRAPISAPRDAAHRAAGMPDLATLLDDARALGVTLIACQSGLALVGLSAVDLPAGIETGGPVSLMQKLGDDARLLSL
ncbi:DsrE family protein [Sphingobium sp. HBC34]|uniref:DsrE family protein n=1 Tax=Sphingobium cyanobacteriorum TaxID=3063954 RepID=A0ABT8ZIR2_9SPHN|nr:DsrE family protein [Sphingobium sp. HBC34]MDO7834419.1 DsrE family protein [Sphingobium sp. HBC34]